MRINKFGQVTNKSNDLLLTPQQYMIQLLVVLKKHLKH